MTFENANEDRARIVNAEPFLSRDPKSIWAKCLEQRDQITELLTSEATAWKIRGLVQKSADLVFPAWVSFEAWIPKSKNGEATHRTLLTISISPTPYCWFEFEYSVECISGLKTEHFGPFVDVPISAWGQWLQYLLGHASRPRATLLAVRRYPWQIWREKNGLKIISPEWERLGWVAGGVILALGSLVALHFEAGGSAVILLLSAVAAISPILFPSRRPTLHVNAGRPPAEPRILRYVDSWQAIISGLGAKADAAAQRLQNVFTQDGPAQGIRATMESISYVTPDGKQERRQLVLSQGRGIVFCHIYPYGDDLFIGWDAHANKGQWKEEGVGSGWNRVLKERVVVNTVAPSIQNITEYDMIDLNSLIEWTHVRFVALIKKMVAENKLDQEIDFKIIRGTRQSLVGESQIAEARS